MFRNLNNARQSAIASNPALLTRLMRAHQINNRTLALSKPPLLSILTNYGSNVPAIGIYLSPQQTGYKPLLPIIDILTGQIHSTDPRGGLTIPIVAGQPRVFLPLSVHLGVVSKEVWASSSKVDQDTDARVATPSSPAHKKKSSISSVISWLGVGGSKSEL